MRRNALPSLLAAFALACALPAVAAAQGLVEARGALSTFPDAQAVLYVNVQRVVDQAMPRVIPRAEYDKMLAEAQKVGFDVRDVDYMVAGVRFADPPPASGLPEFVVVVKGSFNADTLLNLARVGLSTMKLQAREESYRSKPIQVFDLTSLGKPAAPVDPSKPDGEMTPPKPPPYPEVAVTALDANTLIVGVPAYVRAAMDSIGGGEGRLKASTLEMAARDPQALWSLTADIPPSLPQYIQKLGLPPNEEANRILGWLRQVSIANGMDATNFTVQTAVTTDTPEHASAISGLVRMGLTAAEAAARADIAKKAKNPRESEEARLALNALRSFTNRIENTTVLLGVTVPQATVAEFVKREMVKKPQPQTATKRKATRSRRRARRR